MKQLIFLGTGMAMATECYNTCFLLRLSEHSYFLTDAGGGNGILKRMKEAGVDFADLHHMFVTHGHTDHIVGCIWVVRKIAAMMTKGEYEGEFHIYAHDTACNIIETMVRMMLKKSEIACLGKHIFLHEITDGQTVHFLNVTLTAFDICSTKAKQFGYELRFDDSNLRLTCLGDCIIQKTSTLRKEKKHTPARLKATTRDGFLSLTTLILLIWNKEKSMTSTQIREGVMLFLFFLISRYLLQKRDEALGGLGKNGKLIFG